MTDIATETRSVIVERTLPHAPDKVWRALTQGPLIEEWLMKTDFEPVVGHDFKFRADPVPQWDGIIDGKVLEVEPRKSLVYSWGSMGSSTLVTWTLTPTDGGTHLRMEQSGFPRDAKANLAGATYGWQKFIGQLEEVLAKLD